MHDEPETGINAALHLYDNTLRDGEQTVGVAFSVEDKVRIATQLAKTGITDFEAGFPVVSETERQGIRAIVDNELDAHIYCLARLRERDVDEVVNTGARYITLFAPSSDDLMQAKLRCSLEQMEEDISRVVDYAKGRGLFVRFGCEDASRTPLERLVRLYKLSVEAGADFIGFADTTGVAMPDKVADIVRTVRRETQTPISIHCHNDLGLAVANSIAAARAGAEEIQVTVNGLGERAGNATMYEFVLAMKIGYDIDLGIDFLEMAKLSRLLVEITGLEIAFNKPVVGRNAFRHESGIHVQALMSENLKTYQPFPPEWVGRQHEVAFGKHSGRSNVHFLCREIGVTLDPEAEKEVLGRVKALGQERKRTIARDDVAEMIREAHERGSSAPKGE